MALPRRVAGVVGDRGGRAGADVRGGAAPQDPGDLQAPVAKGQGALPGPGRARVLAARRGPEPRHRGVRGSAGLPAYFAMEAYVVHHNGKRVDAPQVPTSTLAGVA